MSTRDSATCAATRTFWRRRLLREDVLPRSDDVIAEREAWTAGAIPGQHPGEKRDSGHQTEDAEVGGNIEDQGAELDGKSTLGQGYRDPEEHRGQEKPEGARSQPQ